MRSSTKKAKAALDASLEPIACIGETPFPRNATRERSSRCSTVSFCESLAGFGPKELQKTVLTYEPVWAIGTGRTATPQQAQEARLHPP